MAYDKLITEKILRLYQEVGTITVQEDPDLDKFMLIHYEYKSDGETQTERFSIEPQAIDKFCEFVCEIRDHIKKEYGDK